MFHNSTTIWHAPHPKSFVREARLVFGFRESMGNAWTWMATKAGRAGKVVSTLTWPIRAPIGYGWKLMKPGVEAAEKGILWTRGKLSGVWEGAKSVGVGMIGKPAWTIGKTPFVDIQRNLIAIPWEIIKGIPRLFYNVARSPLALARATREYAATQITSVRNLGKSILDMKPKGILTATRDALLNVIRPAPSLLELTKAYASTPMEVGRLALESKTQYVSNFRKAGGQVLQGGRELLEAPQRGKMKADAAYQKALAEKKALEAKAAEKTKVQEAAEQVAGGGAAKPKKKKMKAPPVEHHDTGG